MKNGEERTLKVAEYFSALEDPRVVGRASHPLITVIVMALVGVICGANGWDDLEDIADDRKDWFARLLDMPHGIPSADTFRRVLGALSPEVFTECMSSWVRSLAEPLEGQVVAFDGKTMRGALKRTPWGTVMHQVHVWSCKQRLLLGKIGVARASEEIDAARKLLDLIELRGAIVTGDAAHCCVETAQKIVDRGGDYLLHLKGNRPAVHAAVKGFFEQGLKGGFGGESARHCRSTSRGHGRTEVRQAWSVPASAVTLPTTEWPNLRSITMIERTRIVGEESSTERHYYLSSLPPSVRKIADACRQHWDIENGLHWSLDVQMAEDACAIHDETASQNFGTLRRMSLTMLQRESTHKAGIARKRAKAARNTDYLERVLSRGIA